MNKNIVNLISSVNIITVWITDSKSFDDNSLASLITMPDTKDVTTDAQSDVVAREKRRKARQRIEKRLDNIEKRIENLEKEANRLL